MQHLNNQSITLKSSIKVMAEYVMLNSVATDSTSLFYGRAGMSICLFEVARFLDDDFIEEYAFTLLKQSLSNEKIDIRFDTGLSGIGYALDYLIRNKFIDADFFEIFQKQHNIIVEEFIRQDFSDMKLVSLIQYWQILLYFHYVPDKRAELKINELQENCIDRFSSTWKVLKSKEIFLDKELIISLWRTYLKILSLFDDINNHQHIIDYYSILHEGLLKRDLQSLYFISIIASKTQNSDCLNMFNSKTIEYSIHDFYPIDSLRIANLFSEPYISQETIKKNIFMWFIDSTIGKIEENLTSKIGVSPYTATLSSGLSGLILGVISIKISDKHITNEILSII